MTLSTQNRCESPTIVASSSHHTKKGNIVIEGESLVRQTNPLSSSSHLVAHGLKAVHPSLPLRIRRTPKHMRLPITIPPPDQDNIVDRIPRHLVEHGRLLRLVLPGWETSFELFDWDRLVFISKRACGWAN
jgi:hypothetical protein